MPLRGGLNTSPCTSFQPNSSWASSCEQINKYCTHFPIHGMAIANRYLRRSSSFQKSEVTSSRSFTPHQTTSLYIDADRKTYNLLLKWMMSLSTLLKYILIPHLTYRVIHLIVPRNVLMQRPQQYHSHHARKKQHDHQRVHNTKPLYVGVRHRVEDVVPA